MKIELPWDEIPGMFSIPTYIRDVNIHVARNLKHLHEKGDKREWVKVGTLFGSDRDHVYHMEEDREGITFQQAQRGMEGTNDWRNMKDCLLDLQRDLLDHMLCGRSNSQDHRILKQIEDGQYRILNTKVGGVLWESVGGKGTVTNLPHIRERNGLYGGLP
tara:strand:+ start:1791 stop:2270 length:480 start_codon:yes stop_codon:yes gene_type:complete